MYVLLSSSSRPRYKEDILRALAAPVGAKIQFRYSKKLVEDDLKNKTESIVKKEAVICHVNLEGKINSPCPLVPVRRVTIESVNTHGSTLSVNITVGSYVYSESVKFTKNVYSLSNKMSAFRYFAQKTSNSKIKGYFFFKTNTNISFDKSDYSIETWEKTCSNLIAAPSFKYRFHFWTIIKLVKGESPTHTNCNIANRLPPRLFFNTTYSIYVYVFHPNKDDWEEKRSTLLLSSNFGLDSVYPNDVVVDSPYDLKKWTFRLTSSDYLFKNNGWLRIGPTIDGDDDKYAWDIGLCFKTQLSKLTLFVVSILLGLVLSSSSIAAIWTQASTDPGSAKALNSLWSLAAGVVTSFIAILGIKKMWLK